MELPAAILRAFFSRLSPLWSSPVPPSRSFLFRSPPVLTVKGSSSDSGSFLTRSFHSLRRSYYLFFNYLFLLLEIVMRFHQRLRGEVMRFHQNLSSRSDAVSPWKTSKNHIRLWKHYIYGFWKFRSWGIPQSPTRHGKAVDVPLRGRERLFKRGAAVRVPKGWPVSMDAGSGCPSRSCSSDPARPA